MSFGSAGLHYFSQSTLACSQWIFHCERATRHKIVQKGNERGGAILLVDLVYKGTIMRPVPRPEASQMNAGTGTAEKGDDNNEGEPGTHDGHPSEG